MSDSEHDDLVGARRAAKLGGYPLGPFRAGPSGTLQLAINDRSFG